MDDNSSGYCQLIAWFGKVQGVKFSDDSICGYFRMARNLDLIKQNDHPSVDFCDEPASFQEYLQELGSVKLKIE